MRTAFIETLYELAEKDDRIWLLTADLGYSVLERFADRFPERFLNVGIAEQNMVGIATGLALSGNIVFIYSIANFPTLRCVEQIRNDVCYHNTDVKIVALGGGFTYGTLGVTHHATEDLAIMRSLPNMRVVAPGDPVETALAMHAITESPGPFYLRLGRAGEPVVHKRQPNFQIGKGITIRDGSDITLITTGAILNNVVRAADLLIQEGIQVRVCSMPTLKPLDVELVKAAARETKRIVTIEEHSIIGGLGSAVAEVLAEASVKDISLRRLGIPDRFSAQVSDQEYMRETYSLSVEGIVESVRKLLFAEHPGTTLFNISPI